MNRSFLAVLLILAALWLSPAAHAQCPLIFSLATNFAAGTNPWSVAVSDFNADGRLDLAVANLNGNNVSILVGNANGTFQAAVNYAVGFSPYSVAVGDFNGDGRLDLVTANADSDNVSVLLNTTTVPVTITKHPARTAVLNGQSATFSVAAASAAPITYQWRKDGVNLANGGPVSGATTPTLTINLVALADNGAAFDCVASNACGPTPSNPAGLAVDNICPADFNNDGFVNADDFDAFVNAFVAGC